MPEPGHASSQSTPAAVVPAYNEDAILRHVVESLLQSGVEVILVDDGSDTPAAAFLSGLPVHLLRHRANLGQGAALQTGFNYALKEGFDPILSFDADGQHDVKDLQNVLAPVLTKEADAVLGSRFLPESGTKLPPGKKLVIQAARYINFLFSGLLLSDAHNGLRAFSREALKKIRLTENRMAHASEILFEIKNNKLRWKEVPVHVHYSSYAKKKGQTPWDSIKVLFDLVLHKLFK